MKGLGWLSRNCVRSFPLIEGGPNVALNTNWCLFDSLLVDAFVVAPTANGIYLSSVTITASIVSFVFADATTGASIATASAILGVNTPFSEVVLVPLTNGVSGTISVGSALEPVVFADLPKGMHVFSRGLLLEARAMMSTGQMPVVSIGSLGGIPFVETVELAPGLTVGLEVSQGIDNGDPLTLITISLLTPEDFLSPCEESSSPCNCPNTPIQQLNTVLPDTDGNITIEIQAPNGGIVAYGPNGTAASVLMDGNSLCNKPMMPAADGTLPLDNSPAPETPYPTPA